MVFELSREASWSLSLEVDCGEKVSTAYITRMWLYNARISCYNFLKSKLPMMILDLCALERAYPVLVQASHQLNTPSLWYKTMLPGEKRLHPASGTRATKREACWLFCLILDAGGTFFGTFENALLLEKDVGTTVRHVFSLILLLSR